MSSIFNNEKEGRKTKFIFNKDKIEQVLVLSIIIGIIVYFVWFYLDKKP